MKLLKKLYNGLFSTSAAGLYMLLFAAAIGVATFIENDYGTSAAQKVVFKTRWFELLLILFGISIIANIIRYRMIRQKKWAILTFHAAIIVILLGAGITRYFGYEGMMGIREGSSSNTFLSSESYLVFEARQNGKRYTFDEPVLFASLGDNHFKRSYVLGKDNIEVEVLNFIPNPVERMERNDQDGLPTLKVVIGGAGGREEYFVQQGNRVQIRGTVFNFEETEAPGAFNIRFDANGQLLFKADVPYTQLTMATQQRDSIPPGDWRPLALRSLYSGGGGSFVFGDFLPSATVKIQSEKPKMENQSMAALDMDVRINGQSNRLIVAGTKGVEGRPRFTEGGNTQLAVSYGAKQVKLPFSIQLRDFILEKYPGTENASSYASEVTLLDPQQNVQRNQRIYMNHILDYRGYRFFQSSYDPDELGTYLSVNHDFWGSLISYIGYALLTLGLIFTFFDKKSRFRQLGQSIQRMRTSTNTFVFLLIATLSLLSQPVMAEPHTTPEHIVFLGHAKNFGKVVVQDHKGRLKPMNTLCSEVLRKLSRKESLYGMSAEQIVLGMAVHPQDWYSTPLIKLGKHETIRQMIPVDGDLAAYNDFFDEKGAYKLQDLVREAYNKEPRDRGVLDKEVQKLDEKINICSMIFSGRIFRIYPVPNDPNNTWASPADFGHNHQNLSPNSSFAEKFFPAYVPTLQQALHDGNWALADQLLVELTNYQKQFGNAVYPTESKLNAELFLNKINVFSRLGKVYGLLGLAFLALLFTSVFKPKLNLKWPFRIGLGIFAAAVALHAIGLGLRWYVSGRAPWSNGYESMIYIGFTTVLAGMIFSRKSMGGLAATNVLAATILMVAGLSWLDPEITPLVPVLKSYWLTIHVSLEAGSYGFLVLGAIIGVINLIFMIFANQRNKKNIYRMVDEMTKISEMTLIGGLAMISIGTYLGGVWANESWGRYWGWDAKETWALVSILVYAFILHMRFIPGMRGLYAFNVASLFGWASVMMTYFGVNYYLSGLHSYAAGDPVPVPDFVYITVICLIVISLLALWRHRWYLRSDEPARPRGNVRPQAVSGS
ncbi:MAG: cytochrome c biogenesis protein CcsA [Lewinellaceae bacterium]|nr:cytochrome c biogenesis protein CcsA [Saprospiraceae bacterium]MCB9332626.1 cytochrome c biogenesis protein CcsA [Lewinellaceae bacterium]